MAQTLHIGMIGLDTSHCEAFAKLLNDSSHPYHIPGGKVVIAFPGGSDDFAMSYSRIEGFTAKLKNDYGVGIADSPEAVAEQADAILLTSVDGRVHLEQFNKIVAYRKPVFIDKPFAISSADAREMAKLARQHQVPLSSASSLRFAAPFEEILSRQEGGRIIGADAFGPMNIEPTQGGLYWYGIHSVEMLYRALGKGCLHVTATTNEDYEFVVGVWQDGRIGTVRGNRKGNQEFGAAVHREKQTDFCHSYRHEKPLYAGLLEDAMAMFQTGKSSIDLEETIEIIRFIEAANESRETGETVSL